MTLVFSSLLLSLGVALRMILPVIVVSIASTFVWTLLSIPTAGLASHFSEPVTAAVISLLGIRTALALNGDQRRTEMSILLLKSILYGIFLFVLNSALLWLGTVATAFYATWQLGNGLSLYTIKEASESARIGFSLLWLGSNAIYAVVILTVTNSVMAVPLASAAREASHTASGQGFFHGAGRSFLPLSCVVFVSFFLQIYFGLYAMLYALFPLALTFISLVVAQSLPDLDLDVLFKGLAASFGLLWLNSWVWSASALALLKFDGRPTEQQRPAPSAGADPALDIRALRKSRE